jgi:CheY-like chemotaxis protein
VDKRAGFVENLSAMATVLIVDDDPLVRNSIRRLLESSGLGVECARDGFEALNMLHRSAPDLMLLDLDMPDITGLELLHIIARDGDLPRTAVLTAKPSLDSAFDAGRLQVVAYFVKPFTAGMVDRVKDILAGSNAREPGASAGDPAARALEARGLPMRFHGTIFQFHRHGGSDRELGEKLGIPCSTAKSHLRKAMAVFGVASRRDLAAALRDCLPGI